MLKMSQFSSHFITLKYYFYACFRYIIILPIILHAFHCNSSKNLLSKYDGKTICRKQFNSNLALKDCPADLSSSSILVQCVDWYIDPKKITRTSCYKTTIPKLLKELPEFLFCR